MGRVEKEGLDMMGFSNSSSLPRERLLKHGERYLSNVELLAIILRTGSKGRDVLKLSMDILNDFDGSLVKLAKASLNELKNLKGVGNVKAITLKAVFEIARRYYGELMKEEIKKVKNVRDVLRLCEDMIHFEREVLRIVSVGPNLRILSVDDLTVGTSNATLADTKDILRTVIRNGAEGFFMIHNHPSGEVFPSRLDVEISKKLKRASKTLELNFLDHLIISKNGYYSFRENGDLLRW